MAASNSRIDKLGDYFRDGVYSVDALEELDGFRSEFLESYENVVYKLRDKLFLPVTGRPVKSTASIIEKLRREKCRLSQIQDIAGCRIVVQDAPAQERVLELIKVFLVDFSLYDRREKSSSGYRAIHLVALSEKRRIEVQLRTALQHMWAEISEKLADLLDPQIKYGGGDPKIVSALQGLSDLVANVERDELGRAEFLALVKSSGGKMPPKVKRQHKEIERKFKDRRRRIVNALTNIQNEFSKAAS